MEKRVTSAIVSSYMEKLKSCLEVDAAIVGAGPSGLVCACRLAEAGHSVAVFERKLAPGGGIWGGGMLFNQIVLQEDLVPTLEEFGIRHSPAEEGLVSADSVEVTAALIYRAVHSGAKLFNAVTVEDLVYRDDRVCGVVVNWTPVLRCEMHVDPLTVMARCVLDGSGHGASIAAKLTDKAGVRLDTPGGEVLGEKPMWAEVGETATVENTQEVYPGLFVSGMAANAVSGAARMGPVFGGMLKSGDKAAKLIAHRLAS